jgi:hypothetical protein
MPEAKDVWPLRSLIDALPSGPKLPPIKDDTIKLIHQPAEEPTQYIRPNLIIAEGDPTSAGVILVEAAAAVGKTSLANCVSSCTGNPVWDLSRLFLGSNVFRGTLLKAYGGNGFDDFIRALEAGDCCLILDAADEAFAASGAANFKAGIKDLSELLPRSATGPTILLTGRFDTITDTALYLMDEGVDICRMQVDFFDRDQAERFFLLKVPRADQVAERVHEFLNSFFSAVQAALGAHKDWDETKDFLGYAPVLDSLVRFFRDESEFNPFSVLEHIHTDGAGYIWDLLFDVIEHILVRERVKLVNAFSQSGADEEKAVAAEAVYGPIQQIELLLADAPMDYDSPVFLQQPAQTQAGLRTSLHALLREHPMLRRNGPIPAGNTLHRFSNVAFRDFAVAVALTTEDLVEQVLLANSEATESNFNPSPMLSRFLFSSRLASKAEIPIESVGLVVDSHASHVGYDETSLWLSEVIDVDALENGEDRSGLMLQLTESDSIIGEISTSLTKCAPSEQVIALARSISRCQMNVPGMAVQFGGSMNDFIAGPNVRIICDRLISNVGVLRIHRSSSTSDLVYIQPNSIRGTTQSIDAPGAGLRLIAESAPYPWTTFLSSPTGGASGRDSWRLYAAGMELRKIVAWFSRKNQRGGGLRYLVQPMNVILEKGRASRSLFHFCRENGNLVKEDNEYFLRFDFSVPTVMLMNLRDERLLDFLQSYVEWQDRAVG